MITVGILEAGENLPELSPEFGTFGSWFERLLADALAPATFKVYRSYLGELPEAVSACDAYVITGSRASVNDPDQWIEDLGEFSRRAGAEVPVVGVCFGHQLLHKVFGGRVERAAQGWGIGVHDYRVCANVPVGCLMRKSRCPFVPATMIKWSRRRLGRRSLRRRSSARSQ